MKKPSISDILFFIASVIILAIIALYNKYPMTFADSGTYIARAMSLEPAYDRPIGYSLFIRLFSLKATLWTVVIAQAVILNVLISHLVSHFFTHNKKRIHFLLLLLISIPGGASFVVSQISADIFTPISFLALFLFLIERKATSAKSIFYLVLIFQAVISHFSNGLIVLGSLLVLFFFKKSFELEMKYYISRAITVLGVIILSWLFLNIYNYSYDQGFSSNRVSHVVLMARLIDTGILDEYLDENCEKNYTPLCEFKYQFPRATGMFIWNPDSPFYKTGGWDNSKKEYDRVIHDVLSSPYYLSMFIYKSFIHTAQQVVNIDLADGLGSNGNFDQTPSYAPIKFNMRHEEIKFLTSRQAFNHRYDKLMPYYYFLLVISLVIITFDLSLGTENMNKKLLLFGALFLLFYFANAFVCATFSNVVPRYQARLTWLIPLFAFILLFADFKRLLEYFKKL